MALMNITDVPDLREYEHSLRKTGNTTVYGEDADHHWENGVGVSAHGHYIINGFCTSCAEPGTKGTPQTCEAAVTFYPYLLEFGVRERAGDLSMEQIVSLARHAMDVGTSAKLEDLQNTGCTGSADTPILSDATALGSTTTPNVALGRLVSEFYNADAHIGAQGTIYMSPAHAFALDSGYLRRDGDILRTHVGGNKVIVGNYPTNTIFGHLGEVDVFLSEVFVSDAPISVRTNNFYDFRVERVAMAVWDTSNAWKVAIS